jgi:type IV secretory pathway VirB6-like protein
VPNSILDFLYSAIMAAMTLAVILYGVLLSFGMVEKLGRDTFVFLFKITAVIYLIGNSQLIFTTMTDLMDGAAEAVMSYVPPSGKVDATADADFSKVHCLQNVATQRDDANNPMPQAAAWLGVDCMLDSIIGIKVHQDPPPAFDAVFYNSTLDNADPAKSNPGMSRGLLNFFFSTMQSSVVGLVLAIVGAIFIWGTILLIIRAFFIYIMGYMGIAFLAIVSPLFIPMLLFKETKQYFDKWAKLMISFALQPVMMLVFIIFTLTAVDLAVFSGSYSIMYRIAGDTSRETKFDLNKYLTDTRNTNGDVSTCADCKPIVEEGLRSIAQIKADNQKNVDTKTEVQSTDSGGVADKLKYSKCTPELIEKDTTGALKKLCGFTYPVTLWLQDVHWDRMAAARIINNQQGVVIPTGYVKVKNAAGQEDDALTKGQILMREVLASCFFCVMVVFIMNGLLTIVPRIAGDMLGDALQTPDLSKAVSSGMNTQGSGISQQLTGAIKSSARGR